MKFNGSGNYVSSPTHQAFVYERFGIGYFNLARVDTNKHFSKHMIPTPKGDDKHAAAAIGATTRPDGQALDGTIGFMAIRPHSKVHAFSVKQISFFCVQNREPATCALGFRYSPAKNQTPNTVDWHEVGLYGSQTSYVSSWSSPPFTVVFRNLQKLQAFSFGIPIAKLDSWDNTTLTTDKLNDELNGPGTTAYVDSIEFTTWECNEELPQNPLSGVMKQVLNGAVTDSSIVL